MNEKQEIANTLGEAERVDQSRELTDADLDKVAGGHASLGGITNKVHDKVGRTSGIDAKIADKIAGL